MKKNLIVKQHDIKDCGICCLESIIIYYGGYIPLETLRIATKTNKNGTTAFNLIKVAKEIGFDTKGIKTMNIHSDEIILPAIAHIETNKGLNHFVVIYKIKNNQVYIMDPAQGYKKMSIEEFQKEWTNILLLFKPFKILPNLKKKNIKLEIFLKLIEDNKRIIIKTIILNAIICMISILSSYYLKILMNLIEVMSTSGIRLIMAIFALLTIYKIIIEYLKNELSIYLSKNIDCTIIPEFISHIIKIPSDVITTHTSGEILTRINALKEIKEIFSDIIISILLNITLFLTSIFFLIELNHTLFMILCFITIIYILLSILTNHKLIEYINDNIDKETYFNSYLIENIDAIETINHLNINDYKINELYNHYYELIKSNFNYSKSINIIICLKNMINDLGLYMITTIGIILIMSNKMNLLSLITFTSIMNYFIEPIESIMNQLPLFNKVNINIEKISDFLNIDEEKEINNKFKNGDILIKDLTYSYNDYDKTINNLSLKIKEYDRIQIIGRSGCGKSTLCKILNKSITKYKGTIKIHGVNIKDYASDEIRKNIVYVSQREKLFTDTIKNNIILDGNTTENELSKILEITKVQEIVDKKGMRLDSMLYDSGINLSGGERQRIILARSIIKKPKILILDESLSEIDKVREKEILLSISSYLRNTTIIYISHNDNKVFEKQIILKGNKNDKTVTI